MSNAIISIKDLHKYFGKNEVLKGIDLDIQQGRSRYYRSIVVVEIDFLTYNEPLRSTDQGNCYI